MAVLDLVTKEDLQQLKIELITEMRKINGEREKPKKWLRTVDVRALLNISPGTLQNLRINGTIPSRRVGSIFYYSYEDITKLMEEGSAHV